MRPVRLLWGAVLVAGLATAPAVALPAPPAQATPNTIIVSAESARSSSSTKTMPLDCPSTHPFVYGPGASINLISGTAGSVAVESVVPIGGQPRSIEVTAVELGTFTGTWSVIAWAVCGSFTADMQVVTGTTAQNTTASKSIDAGCDTGLGDAMYGTGFRITGGARNVLVHDVIPGTSVDPRGVTVRATARPGTTPNWKLEAFAICANESPTMRIVQASTLPNSNSSNGVSRICPVVGGTQLRAHGYGVQTLGDPAGTNVDGRIALITTAPLSTLSAGAGGVENGAVAQSWRVIVYVICSN
jgi:hypothetical protein